jgi:hypothetical protein
MLWHKSWLETRWRFIAGLGLLTLGACAIVLYYPEIMKLMPAARTIEASGEVGRRIREGIELASDYRGYIWSQWFRETPTQLGTLFAVLLGTGGVISQPSGAATLFTLSLPVSRNRLLAVRAAAGLGEWFIVALVPALVISMLSPAVGEAYSIGSAIVHGICLFVAGAVFFSLALLLSTVFTDLWRPLLIACAVAVVLSMFETLARDLPHVGIFSLMSGEVYFRTGHLPWAGLTIGTAISAAMLYGASAILAQRDF